MVCYLLCGDDTRVDDKALLSDIKSRFVGAVVVDPQSVPDAAIVYTCGDASPFRACFGANWNVIRELSTSAADLPAVSWKEVPLSVHGVGVYYRQFFDRSVDYFGKVTAEHKFQALTESNKPDVAMRTGIYLTPVTEVGDELHFHLLRCSTNLRGPTETFRETDRLIVDRANAASAQVFSDPAPLNHVLAQVYANLATGKARISTHSDKTKDMPANGLLAFCTFYASLEGMVPLHDALDYGYINAHKKTETSALTRMRFRLKKDMPADERWPRQFDVTLYPHSLFLLPLSMNRIYTHEIVPSVLPHDRMATRLGYVIRCSKTPAVFRDGQTFINGNVPLSIADDLDRARIRELYRLENGTSQAIDYGDVRFSLNEGDYLRPEV